MINKSNKTYLVWPDEASKISSVVGWTKDDLFKACSVWKDKQPDREKYLRIIYNVPDVKYIASKACLNY